MHITKTTHPQIYRALNFMREEMGLNEQDFFVVPTDVEMFVPDTEVYLATLPDEAFKAFVFGPDSSNPPDSDTMRAANELLNTVYEEGA